MNNLPTLDRCDRMLLAAFGLALFILAVCIQPAVGPAGAIVLQSAREMDASGSWLQPTVGGVPLLAPLPVAQWVTLSLAHLCGLEVATAGRIGCAAMHVVVALLAAQLAARCFGRRTGLLAGLTTMTTVSLVLAVGESASDLYSAAAILGAIAAFVSVEFRAYPSPRSGTRFSKSVWAWRPWRFIGLFAATGVAVAVCGPVVSAVGLLLPLAMFLALGRPATSIRTYLWCWGWIVIALVAGVWPWVLNHRWPGILEIWWGQAGPADWLDHFEWHQMQSRAEQGLLLAFRISISWGVLFPIGLWFTRHEALSDKHSVERLLWIIGLAGPLAAIMLLDAPRPVLFAAVAPWNVLAAVGIERSLEACQRQIGRWFVHARGGWRLPQWPVSRVSITATFATFAIAFVPLVWDGHVESVSPTNTLLSLHAAAKDLPPESVVAIDGELGVEITAVALQAFRDRAVPLHNLSFILDERLPPGDVLVLTRRSALPLLAQVGTVAEIVAADAQDLPPGEDLTLLNVKRSASVPRRASDQIAFSTRQALHLDPGPWCMGWQLSSRSDVPLQTPAMAVAAGPRQDSHSGPN